MGLLAGHGMSAAGWVKGEHLRQEEKARQQSLEIDQQKLDLLRKNQHFLELQKLSSGVEKQIQDNNKQIADILTAADAKGIARNDPSVIKTLQPFVNANIRLATVGEHVGIPGIHSGLVKAQMEALYTSPTAEQMNAQAAEKARVLAQAKAEGTAAGTPDTGYNLSPGQVHFDAQNKPVAAVPENTQPKLYNFYFPKNGQTMTVDGRDPQALQDAIDRGGIQISTQVQGTDPTSALGLQKPEVRNYREAEISTRDAIAEIEHMKSQLKSGNSLTGLIGTGVRGLSALVGNLVQASSAFGFDDTKLLVPDHYDLSKFGQAAQSSAAFRSNVINLAYALARAANGGGRLSDADVQMQIDRLAADSGDQGQIIAALNEAERAAKTAFVIRHNVLSRTADIGPLPPDLSPTGLTAKPSNSTDEAILSKPLDQITDEDVKKLSDDGLKRLMKRAKAAQ